MGSICLSLCTQIMNIVPLAIRCSPPGGAPAQLPTHRRYSVGPCKRVSRGVGVKKGGWRLIVPVLGLPAQECSHGPQIALVAQEVCLLAPLGPIPHAKRQRVHCLVVATDKAATKVYVLDIVVLCMQVGDLPDVVTSPC